MKGDKFEVGDTVEATWEGGHKSIHVIESIQDSPHGPFYRFYDETGFLSGLHGKFLRKINLK